MAIFPNVYVAMVMISSMGIICMSISYCPYALLGQYHEMKEVQKQCFLTLSNFSLQICSFPRFENVCNFFIKLTKSHILAFFLMHTCYFSRREQIESCLRAEVVDI